MPVNAIHLRPRLIRDFLSSFSTGWYLIGYASREEILTVPLKWPILMTDCTRPTPTVLVIGLSIKSTLSQASWYTDIPSRLARDTLFSLKARNSPVTAHRATNIERGRRIAWSKSHLISP